MKLQDIPKNRINVSMPNRLNDFLKKNTHGFKLFTVPKQTSPIQIEYRTRL